MNKKLRLLLLVVISPGTRVQAQDAKLEEHAKAAIQSLQHKDFSSWKQLYPDKDVMMEIIGRMGDEYRWTNIDPSLKPLLEESYYLKAQSKLLRQFVAYFSSGGTSEGDAEKELPVNWSAMQYQRIQVRTIHDKATDTIMEKYEGWILLKDDIRHQEWVLRFDDVIKYKNRFYGMDIDEPRPLDNISFDDYVKTEEEGSGRQPEAIADSAVAVYIDTAAAVAVPAIAAPRESANYAGTLGTQKITFHWEVFSDNDGSNYNYCSYWLNKQQGSFHFDKGQEQGDGNYLLIRQGNGGTWHLHKTATTITGTWVSPDGSKQSKINLKKIAG